METKKYIAYYRVSTNKQGIDGLGIDAQKTSVQNFIKNSGKGKIVAEYSEVESGKKDSRVELQKALQACKRENATLVIAKIDRLARKSSFVNTLQDANLDFVCCDMPTANKFTISVMAALAQNEAETTSVRTKSALAELKKRGVKLGNPKNLTDKARKNSIETRQKEAREKNLGVSKMVFDLQEQGLSMRKIAQKLNEYGLKTVNGKAFSVATIQHIKKLFS
jgi:DNA invertase Pin-like site-specific DNA recombinase